jgi:hypothetical protein
MGYHFVPYPKTPVCKQTPKTLSLIEKYARLFQNRTSIQISCSHTVIGGDPEYRSSSSAKKDAASWVEMPKSLKALYRTGGLSVLVACAHGRFTSFLDGAAVAFLLYKPGLSDIEAGRCEGVRSSRLIGGGIGSLDDRFAFQGSIVAPAPGRRDEGVLWIGPWLLGPGVVRAETLSSRTGVGWVIVGFATSGNDVVLTKVLFGLEVEVEGFAEADTGVSSRSSIEKSRSCVESGGRLSVVAGKTMGREAGRTGATDISDNSRAI